MKRILFLLSIFLTTIAGMAQYNPAEHTAFNKAVGIAQAVPTDARSYFYDKALFKYRPYQSVAEVNAYLNVTKFRVGHFPVFINTGGTLNANGTFAGGTLDEFWYRDGTANANLVLKTVASQAGEITSGTLAQLRTTTTASKVFNITDFGGGQFIDIGINDTYGDDGVRYIVDTRSHVWKRVYNGVLNLRMFGAVMDGVTDDRVAFQNAVNFAGTSGNKLILDGVAMVKGEISVTRAIDLEGVGVAGNSGVNNVASIIFDNGAVDVNGNATNSLFKFNEPVAYTLYSTSIKNLTIRHVNQTAKNQHTFFQNVSNMMYWHMDNINVYNATGAIVYLQGSASVFTPYAHNVSWSRINGINVGGFLSQSGVQTWYAGGTISHITLEQQINPVSPQPILADFTGFRDMTMSNFIFEGNSNAAVTTDIKSTISNNKFENIWIEYVSNAPLYAFDLRAPTSLKNITIAEGKIRALGRFTAIDIEDIEIDQNIYEVLSLQNGATATLKKVYEQWTADGFGTGDLFKGQVPDSLVGRVKLEDAVGFDGGTYSQRRSVDLFSLVKGAPMRINQQLTPTFRVAQFGPAPTITNVLDPNEGRVIKVTPTASNLDYLRFEVKIPPSFIGSSLKIALRYKVEAANSTGNIKVLAYASGASATGDNGVVPFNGVNYTTVNTLNKRGTWENGYLSIGQISDSVFAFALADAGGVTVPHTVYISDLKVSLGSDLPSPTPRHLSSFETEDDQLPTAGYFVKGDLIKNNNPADTTVGWRRMTTGTSNVVGVDWVVISDKVGSSQGVDFSYGISGGRNEVGGTFQVRSLEANTSIAKGVDVTTMPGVTKTGGDLFTVSNTNGADTYFRVGATGITTAEGVLQTNGGYIGIRDGQIWSWATNDPNGNFAAPIGSFFMSTSNGSWWKKDSSSSAFGWKQLNYATTQDIADSLRATAFNLRNGLGNGYTLMTSPNANTAIIKNFNIVGPDARAVAQNDSTLVFRVGVNSQNYVGTASSIAPDADYNTAIRILSQSVPLTLANPTGSPVSMQRLTIRIRDNGVSQPISYGNQYRPIGVTLPTSTSPGLLLYLECIANLDEGVGITRWDVIAVHQEGAAQIP